MASTFQLMYFYDFFNFMMVRLLIIDREIHDELLIFRKKVNEMNCTKVMLARTEAENKCLSYSVYIVTLNSRLL